MAGNVEVLQYLRANKCPWDHDTCDLAAMNGHVEVLKWARAQVPPCPWTYRAIAGAVSDDEPEAAEWCRANGCPEY